jgi:hypothetical protein
LDQKPRRRPQTFTVAQAYLAEKKLKVLAIDAATRSAAMATCPR